MLNLSAVQRGMFRLTSYHTIDCIEKKRDTYSVEEICLPPRNTEHLKPEEKGYFRRKNGNYSLLDEHGIVKARQEEKITRKIKCRKCECVCDTPAICPCQKKGTKKGPCQLCICEKIEETIIHPATVLKKGDVIIGKIVVTGSKSGEESKTDASVIIQPGEEGIVDRVHVTITPSGYKLVKVVIRVTREPTLGDKLASRSAQKGTIGMVYRQEDMPFTADEITPDIIINPCCLGADSQISLLDHGTQRIHDIVQKSSMYTVRTVDPTGFLESTTYIHSPFAIKPRQRMLKITTWSGREIMCTADHKFLVGTDLWKEAGELQPNHDMLTILHSPVSVSSTDGVVPVVDLQDKRNFQLTEKKCQILARLLGALEAHGYLDPVSFKVTFYLEEKEDVDDFCRDIRHLRFSNPTISKKVNYYKVSKEAPFGNLMFLLGASPGMKSTCPKTFPQWLTKASSETKRQFLCGFQDRTEDYSVEAPQRIMSVRNDLVENHMAYMVGVKTLFEDLGIECNDVKILRPHKIHSKELKLSVVCYPQENIEKYADLIDYAYCAKKRRESRVPIEFLRLRNRGIRLSYAKMQEFKQGDCVRMYIDKVEEIPLPDYVYDFATCSENHSFVANSIVVHNCMPSRMTVGQLVECAIGKDCALNGSYGDATPFTEHSTDVADKLIKDISEKMEKTGFQAHGWETMYNGLTGEKIEARIFIGPTYYQRLKHMVDDKMHARAKGHVTTLTRQPLEGRAKDGGMRFGKHLAEKSENNLRLVCCVAGDKSKLRKHPRNCINTLIPSRRRNLPMAPANHWRERMCEHPRMCQHPR
jgi:hypothetical protein